MEKMSESSSRALTAFWIFSFELRIAVFESALSVRLRPTSSGFLPFLTITPISDNNLPSQFNDYLGKIRGYVPRKHIGSKIKKAFLVLS